MTIADVNKNTNKISCIHCQTFVELALREAFVKDPNKQLPEAMKTQLIQTLKDFKKIAKQYSPTQWSGIATAVFRKAINGKEVLTDVKDKTGITIAVISAQEEGRIGFLSAVALSRKNPEEVIAWDSGTGSFQISTSSITNEVQVHEVDFAMGYVKEQFAKLRTQLTSHPSAPRNTLQVEDLHQLIEMISKNLTPAPDWLVKTNKSIVAIGGSTSIFETGAIATEKTNYTKQQVYEALLHYRESSNEELIRRFKTDQVIASLSLLYAVMNHYAISKISFYAANGSCEGLLIDPATWSF